MDPLLCFRRNLKNEEATVTLHDHSGTEVKELPLCVYIKLGTFIFPRDAPTNFRSKRGAGDFYLLDAVWFMYNHREGSYGEYMQDARRNGVGVVSLVDRKDLIAYLDEDQRPEDCQFVDTTAPLPVPRRTFSEEEPTEPVWEEEESKSPFAPEKAIQTKKIKTRPALSRDASLMVNGRDFKNILELAKDVHKSLDDSQNAPTPTTATAKHSVSLLDQIVSANKPSLPATRNSEVGAPKEPLIPIIVVPAAPSSMLTMLNAHQFLETAQFITTADAKAQGINKENSLTFEHRLGGRKMKIQVIDNPTRLSPSDWKRVVAVFVQGNTWQFKGWKWESPIELLQNVKGFVIDFDDAPIDPKISNWNVHRLTISRSRRHLDATASFQFWSKLEEYLKLRRLIN